MLVEDWLIKAFGIYVKGNGNSLPTSVFRLPASESRIELLHNLSLLIELKRYAKIR